MRIETALNHRDRAMRALADLYSKAQIFRMTSAELNRQSNEIRQSVAKCPSWVVAYLQGAESVMSDNLYRHALEYGSYVGGIFVSHHQDSARYYQKLGFSPEQVCNKNVSGGHYWKGTEKPFFPA